LVVASLSADSWRNRAQIPTARHGIGSGVLDGKLYAIGGSVSGTAMTTAESYDPNSNSWAELPDMPGPSTDIPDGAVIGHRVGMLGGWCDRAILSQSMAFNPGADTWEIYPSMPTPRLDAGAAVVNGKLYVFGGHGYTDDYHDCASTEIYDPSTNSWTYGAPIPTPRAGPGCAVVGGRVYVIGGRQGWTYTWLTTNECYDPVANSWTTLTPMPTPRSYFACTAISGQVYCMGGLSTGATHPNVNEEYDVAGDSWIARTPMSTASKGAAFGVIGGKIYVAGGSNSSGYLHVTQEYTPDDAVVAEPLPGGNVERPAFRVTMTSRSIRVALDRKQSGDLRLYDNAGRQVGRWSLSETSESEFDPADGTSYAKGAYFAELTTPAGVIKTKVVCGSD
jgi:N-acetylneuraminic acid mutarotase